MSGFKGVFDDDKPLFSQIPKFITYQPPSIGDIFTGNPPSDIMKGVIDLNALKEIPLAKKLGIKLPFKSRDGKFQSEISLLLNQPVANNLLGKLEIGGTFTYSPSNRVSFSISGKHIKNKDGDGKDFNEAYFQLQIAD